MMSPKELCSLDDLLGQVRRLLTQDGTRGMVAIVWQQEGAALLVYGKRAPRDEFDLLAMGVAAMVARSKEILEDLAEQEREKRSRGRN